MCIPSRTHLTYNNDKPWFTAKLRQLHQAKEDACRKGDIVLYNQAFNTIVSTVTVSILTSICEWITSFLTDRQRVMRLGNTHPAPVWSALELLRAVYSPHCSSPCTPMTAHLKTPLSSSWSLQTTPHSSASSRTVTSLLTDKLKGPPQNKTVVIIHLPVCRSNSIKASFIFGTQFQLF